MSGLKKSVSPLNIAFSILYIFLRKITSDSRGMASNMIDSCLAERCISSVGQREEELAFFRLSQDDTCLYYILFHRVDMQVAGIF